MSLGTENFQAPIELDTSPFLDQSPLFQEARDRQAALATLTFDTIEEARDALKANITILQAEGYKQGIIGEKLALTAPRLHIPTVTMELEHGTYLNGVSILEPVEDDFFAPPTAEGIFSGFTHTIQGEPGPNDSIVNIKPSLHYQIRVTDRLILPHNEGPQFAYAAVENATLEFRLDKQRRDAAVALGRLLADESNEAQMLTHNLNTMLPFDRFDPRTLRSATKMARLFLERQGDQVTQGFKDGIIDLVTARLGLYYDSEFLIKAISAITPVDESGIRYVQPGIQSTTKVQAVTFAPYFFGLKRSEWMVSPTENAISIAALSQDPATKEQGILNVPFEKLNLLTPLGV